MPLAPLNKKDTTAEKIPAEGHGFGAFCGGGGFASLITAPVACIVCPIYSCFKSRQEEREYEEAKAEAKLKEEERRRRRDDRAQQRQADRMSGNTSGSPTLDSVLQNDPENPRVCDAECPGYGSPDCVVHRRSKPNEPSSPGLLAV
jgi:hypothetical protein